MAPAIRVRGSPLSGGAPQPPGCINLLGMPQRRPAFPRPAVFDDAANHVRPKVIGLYMVLIAANLLAWAWAFAAFHGYPLLLATALIAYGFGLRHAVDADHIAAIDNVTRKFMQEGKRPIAVGFFFSLGHSTVVIAAAILIALTASRLQRSFPGLIEAGGLIGTLVSVIFLFAIAMINLVVLISVFRVFRRAKRGEDYAEEELNVFLVQRGLLSRLFRTLFRLISRSWHMYPLGLLFGLGFDTATEIGLLGIAAAEAAKGLPIWSILVFPALFTAGGATGMTPDHVEPQQTQRLVRSVDKELVLGSGPQRPEPSD